MDKERMGDALVIINSNPQRKGFYESLFCLKEDRNIVVSTDRKFIFMRIFKSAGTTIKNILDSNVKTINNQDNKVEFKNWLESMDEDKLKEYFIFACVRNPWDRLISVASFFEIKWDNFMDNYGSYMKDYSIKRHSIIQSFYTHADSDNFTDMICHFESLQDDIPIVMSNIGINVNKLPHLRKSNHGYYARYYNESTRDRVAKIYSEDIRNYNYKFGKEVGCLK